MCVSSWVVSDTLQPHGLQHTRLPCPSPSPGVCSNSCPLRGLVASNHLIPCRPLLLPSIFPSIRVFSYELPLHIRWPKDWSFNFSINPSNEWASLGWDGKESTCNVGDLCSIPMLGRSPGDGNDHPLQYSDLENSMDCIVHGVAKSQTRLSNFHFHFVQWIFRVDFL